MYHINMKILRKAFGLTKLMNWCIVVVIYGRKCGNGCSERCASGGGGWW